MSINKLANAFFNPQKTVSTADYDARNRHNARITGQSLFYEPGNIPDISLYPLIPPQDRLRWTFPIYLTNFLPRDPIANQPTYIPWNSPKVRPATRDRLLAQICPLVATVETGLYVRPIVVAALGLVRIGTSRTFRFGIFERLSPVMISVVIESEREQPRHIVVPEVYEMPEECKAPHLGWRDGAIGIEILRDMGLEPKWEDGVVTVMERNKLSNGRGR